MEEITQVKKDIQEVKVNVGTILYLLKGDESFGEHGFVKTTKEALVNHEDRLNLLEEEQVRNKQLKKIIFWLISIAVTEGIATLFLIFTKK
jgi:glutaredoxin-related protein